MVYIKKEIVTDGSVEMEVTGVELIQADTVSDAVESDEEETVGVELPPAGTINEVEESEGRAVPDMEITEVELPPADTVNNIEETVGKHVPEMDITGLEWPPADTLNEVDETLVKCVSKMVITELELPPAGTVSEIEKTKDSSAEEETVGVELPPVNEVGKTVGSSADMETAGIELPSAGTVNVVEETEDSSEDMKTRKIEMPPADAVIPGSRRRAFVPSESDMSDTNEIPTKVKPIEISKPRYIQLNKFKMLSSHNVLNALHIKVDVAIQENPLGGFIATTEWNGCTYKHQAGTKSLAKQQLESDIVRDYYLHQMKLGPLDSKEMERLVGYAVYKLFEDWTSVGLVPPSTLQNVPLNWNKQHPTELLNNHKKLTPFQEQFNFDGTYTITMVVDGTEYKDTARNKKLARRNVAAKACNDLFNTSYEMK